MRRAMSWLYWAPKSRTTTVCEGVGCMDCKCFRGKFSTRSKGCQESAAFVRILAGFGAVLSCADSRRNPDPLTRDSQSLDDAREEVVAQGETASAKHLAQELLRRDQVRRAPGQQDDIHIVGLKLMLP